MANDADFYIKSGDTDPPIEAQLVADDGTPVDLTGDAVTFQMQAIGADTLTVDATATVDDETDGLVSYQWTTGDTDDSGFYNAQFGVDRATTGTVDETYPNEQFIVVKVHEGL